MRKLLAAGVCALFLSQPITTLGQATIGTIVFANRNIPTAANDGSTYNVPIYQCNMAIGGVGGFQGAGSLPGGVTWVCSRREAQRRLPRRRFAPTQIRCFSAR
jgi:hypothetical protein